MNSNGQPPLLDYITKLMLLEVIRSITRRDVFATQWINTQLAMIHHRWGELDEHS